jgi:sortase A
MNFKTLLAVLIILSGLSIIAYPTIREKYQDYKGKQALDDIKKQLENGESNIDINPVPRETSNPSDLVIGTAKPQVTSKSTAAKKVSVLGIIRIDKLALELAIVEGTTTEALNGTIAGHYTGTALPNKIGNCVIASHRSLTYGRNFNRLNEVRTGDKIKIKSSAGEIEYTVFKTTIVDMHDSTPLEQPTDSSLKVITLITCDPLGANNPQNRIIVQAKAK